MKIYGQINADNYVPAPGLDVTDNTRSFSDASSLTFNPNNFYLSQNSSGSPVVNLYPGDRPFSGVLVRLGTTTSLVDGGAPVDISWTSEDYDYGDWWSPSSPTDVVVPAGVTMVRILGVVTYISGATAPGPVSFHMTSVQLNGVDVSGCPVSGGNSVVSTDTATAVCPVGVIQVTPGDIITMTASVNWSLSESMSAFAGRTCLYVEAVRI